MLMYYSDISTLCIACTVDITMKDDMCIAAFAALLRFVKTNRYVCMHGAQCGLIIGVCAQ